MSAPSQTLRLAVLRADFEAVPRALRRSSALNLLGLVLFLAALGMVTQALRGPAVDLGPPMSILPGPDGGERIATHP